MGVRGPRDEVESLDVPVGAVREAFLETGRRGKVGDKQWDSKRRQAWFEWGWRINKPAEMAPWSSWWF